MPPLTSNRITSLDFLKGVVMVIMALDHVRDYFHYSSYFFDPADPAVTTIPIFFTRFITNFCAPAFSFLAGLSAFMVGKRKTSKQLSAFLLKRGLWLIFIEIVIINFAWHFDIHYTEVLLQVIWVLGLSMVLLSALIHVPRNILFIICCIAIFGHNLLDPIHFKDSLFWAAFHERQFFIIAGHTIRISYAIIPWAAVMALGYCFGNFYDHSVNPGKRKKLFNTIGIGAIILFILIRGINIYGNLLPWIKFPTFSRSLMSFLNVTKYPPSLDFLLITLGGTLLFLANSENIKGRVVTFFSVYGRVPFFYYIVHLFVIHLLALATAQLMGFGWHKMILNFMPFRTPELRGFGVNLAVIYLVWIAIVVSLYPVCRAFDKYKQGHKNIWWLSYL